MRLELAAPTLIAYLLAMSRCVAWLFIAPPFGTKLIPNTVKIGLAGAITLASGPQLRATDIRLDTLSLVTAIVTQIVTGLALGFLALLLLSAIQAAGSFIDLFAGFTMAQVYDPMSGAGASVFGRLYQVVGTTILFVSGGHLILVRGFLRSFDAVPLDRITIGTADLAMRGLATFVIAAFEIAAPVLAAMFLAEVALGLLTRAAPQLNALQLGMPLKALLALLLTGLALPLIPLVLDNALRDVIRSGRLLTGT
jgi:flagellar biosynthesis protein FliR